MTLGELYSLPAFQNADYRVQQQAKRDWLQKQAESNVALQQADPVVKQLIAQQVMQKAPALSIGNVELTPEDVQAFVSGSAPQGPLSDYKRALWLGQQAQAGNLKAKSEIAAWVTTRRLANETLIGQIAMGAQDVLEQVFAPKAPAIPELASNKNDLSKMSSWLLNYYNESTAQQINAMSGFVAGASSFIESMGLTTLLVGSGGLAGGGLLTKGLYDGMRKLAPNLLTQGARSLVTQGVPRATQAIGGGVVYTMTQLPQMIQEGKLSADKGFVNIVNTFGQGVAWDILFQAGASVIKHVVRPYAKALRKMKFSDEQSFAKAAAAADATSDPQAFTRLLTDYLGGTEDSALVSQLPNAKEYLAEKAALKTLLRTPVADLNSPEGVAVLAKASLHDLKIAENGALRLFYNDKLVYTAGTPKEAVSYLTNWIRGKSFNEVIDETFQAAMRSAPSVETVLERSMTSKVNKTTLSPQRLRNAITPQPNAVGASLDNEAVDVAAKQILRQNGYAANLETKVVPRSEFFSPTSGITAANSNTLLIPNNIASPADEKAFVNYFDTFIRNRALTQDAGKASARFASLEDNLQNLQKAMPTQLSPYSLQAALRKVGGDSFVSGSEIHISLPNGEQQVYHSLADANKAVAKQLLASGLIDENTFAQRLAQNTNFSVKKEINPTTGLDYFVVRDPKGNIRGSATTLSDLVQTNPSFVPKLPESLGPELSFVKLPHDSEGIRITDRFAAGTQKEMRDLLNGFTSYNTIWGKPSARQLSELPDGSKLSLNGPYRLHVEIPNLGFRQEFTTLSKAKKFLETDSKLYTNLDRMAGSKGYRLDITPSGMIAAQSPEGEMTFLKNKKELEQLLAAAPDPEWAPNLIKAFDGEIDSQLAANAKAALNADESMKAVFNPEEALHPVRDLNTLLGGWWRPMKSTLERISQKTGERGITDTMRNLEVARRMYSVESFSGMKALRSIIQINGKTPDRNTLHVLTQLLEVPPDKWKAVAKSAFDFDLLPAHTEILNRSRLLFDYYSKEFGVDSYKMLSNYAPKIRNYLKSIQTDPKQQAAFMAMNKLQQLKQIFGSDAAALKTTEFFAKHTRLDTFLTAADNKNLITAMQFYIDHGLREKHMSKAIDAAEAWRKTLAGNPAVDEADFALISSYLDTFGGKTSNPTQTLISKLSLNASHNMAEGIRKLKGVIPGKNWVAFIDDAADSMLTQDLPSKLESLTTYSTLGARPIRALTNMMQYNNTMAVFGRYADEALSKLTGKEADHIMELLFRKGILNERIFSSGAEAPKALSNILDRSLRSQQNIEYLTRAWTAKAAALGFDENFHLLAKGKIDFKQFAKLSNIDFLSPASQQQIFDAIKAGQPNVAKDIFQVDAVRLLMFDYTKENYPLMFKGALGRAFGKFGVYPVGQIDMYNNILSRGDAATRTIRAARLLAITTATYEAFRVAGLDYHGFLFYDPFQFAGGPLFQTMEDALNSRDTGPQGAFARQRLAKSWQLALPFSVQARKMGQALTSFSQGNLQKGLIESMSGTYTPDSLLNGPNW